ncbi:hypothetical protein MIC97_00875 [Aquamicrobium sp. NLF2-7]|uniref:hypothetical protein n=1 Tax=Aquamicrobium sp. NLF2-7 TaxID=2918753 RepID=UPI001EFA672F|nr:hypothetical protein [Aquamicrobium sp. NLF2-7]MCG8270068.1 hypothetical protein [Aquamicrobium sp. NLF2-7]
MSALYFDQLKRQKTMRGKKLLSDTNLDSHKPTVISAPPIPDNGKIRIERNEDGATKIIVSDP